MTTSFGHRVGLVAALLGALSACSGGGGANTTGASGASGSKAGSGGGTAGATASGGAGSSAGGSGSAGSGAAGTGAAGTGAAGSTGGGGTGGGAPTDGGAPDGSSSAHDGPAGETSCSGRAISMSANGSGSDSDAAKARVIIDLMADMPLGNASRTIEFWFYVKPTDWIAEKNEILFYGALTGGTRQVIGLDFGQPPVTPAIMGMPGNHATLNPWTDGVYDDDTGKYLGVNSTVAQWVHVALVWDGLAFRTYVNGVARITTPAPTGQPLATLAGLFYVGCLPLNFSCFNGLFDELRVWSVARTPEEIMANYTKAVVGNEPGLVGYWKFDDAPGATTAKDSVTTAGHTPHDGVLMAATDAGVPTFVTPDPPSPVTCP